MPWRKDAPLAARMRPRTLEEFIGQKHILGEGKLLRRAIQADRLGSMILWGPPGSGKTTLARVVANATSAEFATLNAVLAGVKDTRQIVAAARERMAEDSLFGRRKTILFVDEVHRFNKAQQDALLPHVENGTIRFIGATTENPYFEVIKALVSRSRIFELRHLSAGDLRRILAQALEDSERGYGDYEVQLDSDALEHLVQTASGDARNALNALELAVQTTPPREGRIHVTLEVAEESIQRRALLYDKDGDAHYDTTSALIKSLRGSDPDASLYWMAKMIAAGEDPRFIARRLVIFASEDVGMADPRALGVAIAAAHAVDYVGLPECQYNLSQACIYLATAPKSNSAMGYFSALRDIQAAASDDVPSHLKDPSRDRKGLGHGEGYRYPHAFREHWVAQQYLPDEMQGRYYYEPGALGFEAAIAERVEHRRRRQMAAREQEARLERDLDRRSTVLHSRYGRSALRLREELLRPLDAEGATRALVLGREDLLGWGLLERFPWLSLLGVGESVVHAGEIVEHYRAEGLDKLLRVLIGKPSELPFAAGSLDRIVGWRILGDHSAPAAVAGELCRVLRAGGQVALAERARDDSGAAELLERAGLQQVERRGKRGAELIWARRV